MKNGNEWIGIDELIVYMQFSFNSSHSLLIEANGNIYKYFLKYHLDWHSLLLLRYNMTMGEMWNGKIIIKIAVAQSSFNNAILMIG